MISEFELSRRPGSSTTERHAYPLAAVLPYSVGGIGAAPNHVDEADHALR